MASRSWPTGGVFKSNFLCVLVQIASIPADEEQRLDQLMRTYDGNVNSIPGVACRVWLFRILEVLVQGGLVRCADLQALEAECMDCGNQHPATSCCGFEAMYLASTMHARES
jgi:hypothetical protein